MRWMLGRYRRSVRFLGVLAWASVPGGALAADVEVAVGNVRNAQGHVLVALCSKTDFLSLSCERQSGSPARPGTVTVTIRDVRPDRYAVQAYQDENDNLKLDTNFLGLPVEGIGFGNDAKMLFGPPTYDDAAVIVPAAGMSIRLELRYTFD